MTGCCSSGISLPADSKDYSDTKWEAVKQQLKDSGFTNIECRALGDLTVANLINPFTHPGEVDQVSINGNFHF